MFTMDIERRQKKHGNIKQCSVWWIKLGSRQFWPQR